MKCVNCKFCVNFIEGYYICNIDGGLTPVEECIANDDNIECDGYVDDMDDDY